MADDDDLAFEWFRKPGHICYKNGSTKDVFCGKEEECFNVGMVLPFVNESTWDWRVRAALYGFALLYRCRQFLNPPPVDFTELFALWWEQNKSQTENFNKILSQKLNF